MSEHKRRRRRSNNAASQSIETPPPFITRTAPTYDILFEDQAVDIEEAAEDILQNIGVEVRHAASLELLKKAGCHIEGNLVKFDRGFCRKIVKDSAPSEFVQHARNPEKSVKIGGNALVLVPIYGPPFVAATDIERSYGTLEDFNNFVRLAHMSPELHHTGGPICEPTDIPVSKRHLDMNYAILRFRINALWGLLRQKSAPKTRSGCARSYLARSSWIITVLFRRSST